jgi:hypothetical protein
MYVLPLGQKPSSTPIQQTVFIVLNDLLGRYIFNTVGSRGWVGPNLKHAVVSHLEYEPGTSLIENHSQLPCDNPRDAPV